MLIVCGFTFIPATFIFLELGNVVVDMQELLKGGQKVALRSQHEKLIPGTSIYVVDTLGIQHLPFSFFLDFNLF